MKKREIVIHDKARTKMTCILTIFLATMEERGQRECNFYLCNLILVIYPNVSWSAFLSFTLVQDPADLCICIIPNLVSALPKQAGFQCIFDVSTHFNFGTKTDTLSCCDQIQYLTVPTILSLYTRE